MSQDQLAEVRERYKQGSSSVNDLARELAQVSTHMLTEYLQWSLYSYSHRALQWRRYVMRIVILYSIVLDR